MARSSIDGPAMEKTTITVPKVLMDRLSVHVRKNGDNQSNFITRAIVNLLENEGDITIRLEMEAISNGY